MAVLSSGVPIDLRISESTCNGLGYSRQHQDDIVLDVARAFLNEKFNPCWKDINCSCAVQVVEKEQSSFEAVRTTFC